jgi:phosphomevalonate kinase
MFELNNLSGIGCESLMNNKSSYFLDIITKFYNVLFELSNLADIDIISDQHQRIAKIIQNCGGVYKPSGAGGYDIGIAFTDRQSIKQKIIEQINKSYFKFIKLSIV